MKLFNVDGNGELPSGGFRTYSSDITGSEKTMYDLTKGIITGMLDFGEFNVEVKNTILDAINNIGLGNVIISGVKLDYLSNFTGFPYTTNIKITEGYVWMGATKEIYYFPEKTITGITFTGENDVKTYYIVPNITFENRTLENNLTADVKKNQNADFVDTTGSVPSTDRITVNFNRNGVFKSLITQSPFRLSDVWTSWYQLFKKNVRSFTLSSAINIGAFTTETWTYPNGHNFQLYTIGDFGSGSNQMKKGYLTIQLQKQQNNATTLIGNIPTGYVPDQTKYGTNYNFQCWGASNDYYYVRILSNGQVHAYKNGSALAQFDSIFVDIQYDIA
jgi:hypothetical protein